MLACVSKYRRLHINVVYTTDHRDYIQEPAAIVDRFAGSGARRLRFMF